MEPQYLTAAECAARTGLTVRALRVYEQYGLISPRRSGGGWRQYEPQDLARLNSICVLKAAGLSLLQIRDMIRSEPGEPVLRQVLQIQLGSCRDRIKEAQRGLAIVEQALLRLDRREALSVDDLCALIRNIERPAETFINEPAQAAEEELADPQALDSYAGFYQGGEFGFWRIFRDGDKLLAQMQDRPPFELQPTAEAEFELAGVGAFFRFQRDERNAVNTLVMHAQGTDWIAKRIDAAAAEDVRAKRIARIEAQKPLPGSEAALRRLIDSVARNEPNYGEMSEPVAYLIRTQLPQLRVQASCFGPVLSVQFQGVGSQAFDVFDVRREHGSERYRIILGSDGKIANVQIVPANAPVSLGP
jgi:DNA-binding transcriptional MerR regulator